MEGRKLFGSIFVSAMIVLLLSGSSFAQENKTEVISKENTSENLDTVKIIKNISTEIKEEISYCIVQIAAFSNKKTKRQFKKEFDFHEYPISVKKEEDLYKFLIKKKFYNKGGENLFDSNNKVLRSAVRVQMKCKRQFNFIDAFIAVYDKKGKRIAIIKDVPKMKYIIF